MIICIIVVHSSWQITENIIQGEYRVVHYLNPRFVTQNLNCGSAVPPSGQDSISLSFFLESTLLPDFQASSGQNYLKETSKIFPGRTS